MDYDTAYQIVLKWVPPITPKDKDIMYNLLNGTHIGFGVPMLRKYIELLHPYLKILRIIDDPQYEADCLASGVVFFYGCLLYIMHFPNWGTHIEDIFLYNLLYIMVDHYIDNTRMDPKLKADAIKQMYILVANPESHATMTLVDPVLKVIAVTYAKLLQRCPAIKACIIELFESEVQGLHIQRSGNSTREQYYNIALRKGGLTMKVMQHIVGDCDPNITAASYHIGTIMQLIDDSVDVLADKNNGIHTIATHELATVGNLDAIWCDIANRINNIDPRFKMYVIVYTAFTVYLPDRLPQCYTAYLRKRTNPINLYDRCDGSGLLVQTIKAELAAIEVMGG